MKKVLATIFSLLFLAAVSFAVVGCNGKEQEQDAIELEAPEIEVPTPDAEPVSEDSAPELEEAPAEE